MPRWKQLTSESALKRIKCLTPTRNHPRKMLNTWLGALCCVALGLTAARSIDEYDEQARSIVDNLTTEQVLGQLAQVGVSAMLNEDYSLNETLVRDYAKLKIGSYLTTPFTNGPNELTGAVGWDVAEWRDIITRIQEIAMEENDGIPMVYGIDTVHGAGFVLNSTMFGAQLNGAATFNPDLVYEMGRIGAQDTRAAGIPWVFGPILEIASNPLWPRTYETFGEDPHLVSVMADAVVRGLQSDNQTAACMKHFVAYRQTNLTCAWASKLRRSELTRTWQKRWSVLRHWSF